MSPYSMGPEWRNFAPKAALTPSLRWEIGLFQGWAPGQARTLAKAIRSASLPRVPSAAHRHAAIHPDDLAGDIGGILRGEERHGGGDFLGLAVAAHRHQGQRGLEPGGVDFA